MVSSVTIFAPPSVRVERKRRVARFAQKGYPETSLVQFIPARCGKPDTLRGTVTRDIRIALYQPDIAGNAGTIIRMAACLGLSVNIIEPAGFDVSDRNLRRAGMDYLELAAVQRHLDFDAFDVWRGSRRLVLFSTKAAEPYAQFAYRADDILLFGRESAGVPDDVHARADVRLVIPQLAGRSLNLAVSVAMAAGEAIRQAG